MTDTDQDDWVTEGGEGGGGGRGSYTTPSREGGRDGRWYSRREALPHHRAMVRRPKRWYFVVAGFGEPDRSSMALLRVGYRVWEGRGLTVSYGEGVVALGGEYALSRAKCRTKILSESITLALKKYSCLFLTWPEKSLHCT